MGSLLNTPAYNPVCNSCGGGEHLLFDAYVSWNPNTQEYEMFNVFDKPVICESKKCDGGEVSVTWIPE